jgi:hypothetical protein
MRRTSLVLAVVAAMVTVLVFAAPAFAVQPDAIGVPSDPGIHTEDPTHCPAAGEEVTDLATILKQPGKSLLDAGEQTPDPGDDTPGAVIHGGQTECLEDEAALGTVYKPGLGHDDPQAPGGE